MAESKKYYWLKLKEDFFDDDTIQWIEEQVNGKDYCLFYLKLCLKSLKNNGVLIRNVGGMLIPYDTKKISELTRTDIDTVRVAMEVFQKLGLVQVLENGEIFLTQLENMVGSETKWAKYKQNKKIKEPENQKQIEIGNFPTEVQFNSNECPKKVQTEREIENRDKRLEIRDKRLERENTEEEMSLSYKVIEILNYYENKTCNSIATHYQLISLIAEKNSIEDIKEALSNALSKGKKGKAALNYANGILKNWAEEGKPEKGVDKDASTGQNAESSPYDFSKYGG